MFNCSIINSASTECQIPNRKVQFLLMDRNAPWLISCCKNCPRCVCEWTRHNISKFWPFVPVHSRGQSVAHKWLNFAPGECSNMQENSFGSTVQILIKCSNRKRLPAQSSATTTQFHFVRMWGSKLSSTQLSKNQWNLGIGVRGNGETDRKSGGQKTIKRTRVKERDMSSAYLSHCSLWYSFSSLLGSVESCYSFWGSLPICVSLAPQFWSWSCVHDTNV